MTLHGPPGLSPRILDTLRQLGLTEYGARCYVALLSLKGAEASAIAEAAEVPRTKVYAVLKDLVDDGWALAEGGRPVTYRAVAPEERIAQAEKRIAQDASDATRELQARFAARADMIPMSVYLLRGREAILAKSFEVLARAREDAFVNLGFLMEGEAAPLVEGVRKARARGVAVRVMIGPRVDARAVGELAQGARVAPMPFHAVAVDRRQAVVVLANGPELVALWNPTQAFVEAIAPMLDAAWAAAPPRHEG